MMITITTGVILGDLLGIFFGNILKIISRGLFLEIVVTILGKSGVISGDILGIVLGTVLGIILGWFLGQKIGRTKAQVFVIIAFVLTIFPFVWSLMSEKSLNPQNIDYYEIVYIDEDDYVIITTVGGKHLVADFSFDENNNRFVFYTSNYFFIDEYEGNNYNYIYVENTPYCQ